VENLFEQYIDYCQYYAIMNFVELLLLI